MGKLPKLLHASWPHLHGWSLAFGNFKMQLLIYKVLSQLLQAASIFAIHAQSTRSIDLKPLEDSAKASPCISLLGMVLPILKKLWHWKENCLMSMETPVQPFGAGFYISRKTVLLKKIEDIGLCLQGRNWINCREIR